MAYSIFTLNTWRDEQFEEGKRHLENGEAVHFGSTAIGHTRAYIVESEAIKWAKDTFGEDNIEIVEDEWGFDCVKLKNK